MLWYVVFTTLWLVIVKGLPAPPGKLSEDSLKRKATTESATEAIKRANSVRRKSDAFAEFFEAFGGDVFDFLGDIDGDGRLSQGEVREQWGEDAMALQLTTAIDTSQDGALDSQEIEVAARRILLGSTLKPDRESYVTHLLFKELKRKQQTSKALAVAWSPHEINTILKTFDANNDGTIQTIEMMTHKETLKVLRGDGDELLHNDNREEDANYEDTLNDDGDGVVARFVRTFFFGYLTPAADLRRMWSVYRNLTCSCVDVEADTENMFWFDRAPCLNDADLERLFKKQQTRCNFPANATILTRRDYRAILSFGDVSLQQERNHHNVSSCLAPDNDTEKTNKKEEMSNLTEHILNSSNIQEMEKNEDDLDDIVLTFEEFRNMLQIQSPAEIAGAVSHLIHGGQLDVARTLLIRQVADLLSAPTATTSTKLASLLARDLNWTPPVAPIITGSGGVPWDKVLRDRELATLKAWLIPTACVLILIAICAYVASLVAKLDAMVRDYDQIRAYLIGYLEADLEKKKKEAPSVHINTTTTKRDPILAFLTDLSFERGGLLPSRYGIHSDIGQAAYSSGAALANIQDDNRQALGASEIAALLKQTRTSSNNAILTDRMDGSSSLFTNSPRSSSPMLSHHEFDDSNNSNSSPRLQHHYRRQRGESFNSSGGF